MPEGPEVESARLLVEQNLSGLRITGAHVADDESEWASEDHQVLSTSWCGAAAFFEHLGHM